MGEEEWVGEEERDGDRRAVQWEKKHRTGLVLVLVLALAGERASGGEGEAAMGRAVLWGSSSLAGYCSFALNLPLACATPTRRALGSMPGGQHQIATRLDTRAVVRVARTRPALRVCSYSRHSFIHSHHSHSTIHSVGAWVSICERSPCLSFLPHVTSAE